MMGDWASTTTRPALTALGFGRARDALACKAATAWTGGGGSHSVRGPRGTSLSRLRVYGRFAVWALIRPWTRSWPRCSPRSCRLFSHISTNWRGRPLVSHEAVVELTGQATTATGLRVHAELDPGAYPTGVKVTDEELAAVPTRRHEFHGEWNYTTAPDPSAQPP